MASGQNVPFACKCGTLHGVLHNVSPRSGGHVKCYCRYCQMAARHFGDSDALDEWGGTSIFQSLPSRVEFQGGGEHLACMRLSPKGLMRWYASCCNVLMFNMLGTPKIPMANLISARVADDHRAALGPVTCFHSTATVDHGAGSLKDSGNKRAMARLLSRALGARLRRDSAAPFFAPDGSVSVRPYVLTLDERRAAEIQGTG